MINEDPNVSRVLDALLTLFNEHNHSNPSSQSNTSSKKEDKDIRKFFKRSTKAIKKNGLLLNCLAEEYRIPGLCFLAVKQNGNALEFVPEKYKSPAICLKATYKNPEAIKFVPQKLKSICQTQIDLRKGRKNSPIGKIKRIFQRNPEIQTPKLDHNSQILVKILNILDNPETGLNKQQQETELSEYFRKLPHEMMNFDLCRRAIEYSPRLLPYIPQNFQIGEICKSIVSKNYQALNDIPEIERDLITCLIAYLNNDKAITIIPPHLKKEVIEKALLFQEAHANIHTQSDLEAFLKLYGKIADYVLPTDFIKTQMLKIKENSQMDTPQVQNSEEADKTIKNNIEKNIACTLEVNDPIKLPLPHHQI